MLDRLEDETLFEKSARGDRLRRSQAARVRRKETKEVMSAHLYKELTQAEERLEAERAHDLAKKMKKS